MVKKTRLGNIRKSNIEKTKRNESQIRKKQNRYRLKLILSYLVIFSIVTALGAGLSIALLFKIDKISVIGDSPYSYDELLENSGIKVGNNLFLINTKASENKIEKSLTYIEKASISKKFPNEVIIKLEPAKKEFAFKTDQRFIVLSNSGKVLEICDSEPDETALVKGINLKTFEVGSKATYEDIKQGETFENLISLLSSHELNKITGIDFSSSLNIIINYEHRLDINLGLYENIDYKLRMAKEIINTKIGEKESGVLELSTVSKDNRSYFKPTATN
ncbi:MAG: Cell division protein DivIB [Eubacteriales bacterium SKADARSKE-1]|nr:Cell division protein DivIB [Eubacteriales bacterium SKADARSKE-1]